MYDFAGGFCGSTHVLGNTGEITPSIIAAHSEIETFLNGGRVALFWLARDARTVPSLLFRDIQMKMRRNNGDSGIFNPDVTT